MEFRNGPFHSSMAFNFSRAPEIPNWTNPVYRTQGISLNKPLDLTAAYRQAETKIPNPSKLYFDHAVPTGVLPWQYQGRFFGSEVMPWAGGLPTYIPGHGNQVLGHSSAFGSQQSASSPGTFYRLDGRKPYSFGGSIAPSSFFNNPQTNV